MICRSRARVRSGTLGSLSKYRFTESQAAERAPTRVAAVLRLCENTPLQEFGRPVMSPTFWLFDGAKGPGRQGQVPPGGWLQLAPFLHQVGIHAANTGAWTSVGLAQRASCLQCSQRTAPTWPAVDGQCGFAAPGRCSTGHGRALPVGQHTSAAVELVLPASKCTSSPGPWLLSTRGAVLWGATATTSWRPHCSRAVGLCEGLMRALMLLWIQRRTAECFPPLRSKRFQRTWPKPLRLGATRDKRQCHVSV